MGDYTQGDIIKMTGFRQNFVIVSNNTFIKSTGVFHVCPFLPGYPEGPVHIAATGRQGTEGTAIIEQIKLIDPSVRACRRLDTLPYRDVMEISDALQSVFEYD